MGTVICKNPRCRFILDRRIDGKSLDNARVLKKCPAGAGDWTSICPCCGQALAVKLIDELPYPSFCGQKLSAKAQAA
jgi:hypothetical protein